MIEIFGRNLERKYVLELFEKRKKQKTEYSIYICFQKIVLNFLKKFRKKNMCWNYLKREKRKKQKTEYSIYIFFQKIVKNCIEFLKEIQKKNMYWNYLKREEREKQKTEYSIYMFLENCRKKLY